MNTSNLNIVQSQQIPQLPITISSQLNKRVSSKLTSIFKKTVVRIFTFNTEKANFSYVKGDKSTKIYSESEILNFSPNVEKEMKITDFKYDFRIYLKEKKYDLYTNEKSIYDEWIRVLNFFFYKVDILMARIEVKRPEIVKVLKTINSIEEKIETKHNIEKEVQVQKIKEEPNPIEPILAEEIKKESKLKDFFKFEIENLILTNELEEQEEYLEEKIIEIKQGEEILKENANNTNEDYNRLHKNVTRKILKEKVKQQYVFKTSKSLNKTKENENQNDSQKNNLNSNTQNSNTLQNEDIIHLNQTQELPVEVCDNNQKISKELNFNTNKLVENFEEWN
jgi:hypothetical protein